MRFSRDGYAGLFLLAVALLFGVSAAGYHFGSLLRMGPGFYPLVISIMLGGLGLALLVSGVTFPAQDREGAGGLAQEHPPIRLDLRATLAVLGSICVFGLVLEKVGFVVSIFLLVAIASVADRKARLLPTVYLASALVVITVSIFLWGLGINIPLFRWPF